MIQRYREIRRQKAAGERDDSGFTLIELLIVIVVMGILAAVVVFALGGVTGSSAVASCKADAKTVETAVAAFQVQSTSASPTATGPTSSSTTSNLVPTYLKSFPSNTSHYFIGIGQDYPAVANEVDIAQSNGTTTPPVADTNGGTNHWQAFDTESTATAAGVVTEGCNGVS